MAKEKSLMANIKRKNKTNLGTSKKKKNRATGGVNTKDFSL